MTRAGAGLEAIAQRPACGMRGEFFSPVGCPLQTRHESRVPRLSSERERAHLSPWMTPFCSTPSKTSVSSSSGVLELRSSLLKCKSRLMFAREWT